MPEPTYTADSAFVPFARGEAIVATEPRSPSQGTPSGGVIYTDDDRPTIEQLLAGYRVLLPENRPANEVITVEGPIAVVPSISRGAEAIIAAAVTGAVCAVGILLLISTIVTGHIRANPVVAMSLALGGFGLTATLVTVVRHSGMPSE